MNTAKSTALLILFALTLAARAGAQHWFHEIDLRTPGEVVWQTQVEGDLDREDPNRQYKMVVLPPQFTGPGYRFEVDYQMTRTKTTYPYWDAVPRIDAPAADGQIWGRSKMEHFQDTVSGSWFFHGEAHESVRPHRIRFTFNQNASFPYQFQAVIRVRRTPSANIGGALRETPEWVRAGSVEDPSWVSGDVWMKVFNHRWLLFSLEPGAQLRVKSRAGVDGLTADTYVYATVWNLDHDLLAQSVVMFRKDVSSDTLLRTNTTATRQWYIVGIRAGGTIRSMEMGFYSPQGAAPAINEAPAVNPYELVARDVRSWTGPSGASYEMPAPGDGEMFRLKVRVQKSAWMGGGTSAAARCHVYAQDGTVLKDFLVGGDNFGLENGEGFIEIDRSTDPAKRAVRLVLTAMFTASTMTADAIRYRRIR